MTVKPKLYKYYNDPNQAMKEKEEDEEKALKHPEWDRDDRIHNWRNHISKEMKEKWSEMCELSRRLIYRQAKKDANNETQWDE